MTPLPTAEDGAADEASALYRAWKSWDDADFARLTDESRVYFQAELKQAEIAADGQDVLEIGFGNGQFARFCQGQGWSYAATEIDPELVARANAHGFEAHEAPDDLAQHFLGRHFSLIAAFDVLEHLPADAVIAMLSQCRALLAPGGRLLARFPSGDSPFSGRMYNGDMTHRSLIGTGMVQQLCLASGLRPVQVRGPASPVRGLGWRRALRRAAVQAARAPVRAFLRAAFYDNRPCVIDPNMVIVLARDDD